MRWARIRMLAQIVRFPIGIPVTLTAAAGYLLFARRPGDGLAAAMAGTWLTAAASSILNQVQEAGIDARMARTRGRPIPTGRISRAKALLLAAVLGTLGIAVLASMATGAVAAACLAAVAMAWYNGVYTPLKRITAFAAVPGALVGAIPPVIGWVAAGGSPADPTLAIVCGFFVLWQVPHFWLIVLRRADEYAAAGLPVLTGRLDRPQILRITASWVLATAAAGLLCAGVADVSGRVLAFAGIGAAILAVKAAGLALGRGDDRRVAAAFRDLNAYALLTTLVLMAAGFG